MVKLSQAFRFCEAFLCYYTCIRHQKSCYCKNDIDTSVLVLLNLKFFACRNDKRNEVRNASQSESGIQSLSLHETFQLQVLAAFSHFKFLWNLPCPGQNLGFLLVVYQRKKSLSPTLDNLLRLSCIEVVKCPSIITTVRIDRLMALISV